MQSNKQIIVFILSANIQKVLCTEIFPLPLTCMDVLEFHWYWKTSLSHLSKFLMSLFSNSDNLIFSVKWWKMQHFTKQIVAQKWKAIERIFAFFGKMFFFSLLLFKKKNTETWRGFFWIFFFFIFFNLR